VWELTSFAPVVARQHLTDWAGLERWPNGPAMVAATIVGFLVAEVAALPRLLRSQALAIGGCLR